MSTSKRHPLISYQPIKLFYQLAYITTLITRFPVILITSLIHPLRPHPQWTIKQTLMAKIAYYLVDLQSRIGITQSLTLKNGKEGSRFQVINPASSTAYQGPLTPSQTVKPGPVGGTWFPKAPGKDKAAKMVVVLYLHGGAYVQGDGRNENVGFAGKTMVECGGVDAVFSLQYRLSGYAGLHPFPAALQDAITGYLFLIHELGIPSSQIVLCGDSAGGNLVIALLRYIKEFGSIANPKIPEPRCATLVSPWVAPFESDFKACRGYHTDYLPMSFLQWGAHAYAGDMPNAQTNPYITALGNPFATSVPIFVNVGMAEIFLEANRTWVAEMKRIGGNRVELNEEDAAVHDTFLTASLLGWEESARGVIEKLGAFIGSC